MYHNCPASEALLNVDFICSASLKTYAHDDISVGSWMIGLQATHIDDNRLCCSSIRQGECASILLLWYLVFSHISTTVLKYYLIWKIDGSSSKVLWCILFPAHHLPPNLNFL